MLGLHPSIDSAGNVFAAYEAAGSNPVIVDAHLDTVFPASTPLHLRRKAKVLFMPGISDNGSGIVALVWALRAAKEAGLRFRRPVIAVGSVGEEGEGNLRGVRHLLALRRGVAETVNLLRWTAEAFSALPTRDLA